MDQVARARDEAAGAGDTELAFSKINLALHVGAERADGYHDLESLVVFADVADAVTAQPVAHAAATTLDISGPQADPLAQTTASADNLVLRAAQAIAARASRSAGPVHLSLDKWIPVAAGLGGGSADAAATLRLLNRVWKLGLGPETLAEIGVRLGADVPMCLVSRPLVASGIGERVAPVAGMPALAVVLANPGIAVPTGAVFAGLGKEERAPLPALPPRFKSTLDLVHWLRQTRNDLIDPARVVSLKAVAAAKALAADPDCAFARMTGSGATAFGLFMSQAAAERAAERLKAAKPAWWVAAAMTGGS
jgi:4-diphosphocytidyl-2-C-methyl-D-erythritol kinase